MIESLQTFYLEYGIFIKSLLAGSLVSAACGLIGCFIILRRLSFLSDALAHSMLTGVIVGYLFVKIVSGQEPEVPAMIIGALVSGLLTVAMVSFVTRVSRIKQDTAIGIMYTGIFAVGGFVISLKSFSRFIQKDLYHLIIGDVLAISDADLWMLAIILVLVFSFITLFFRQLQLTSFDPVMAAAIGIPVALFEFGLTISTSLVVVGGVTIVGVILVVALMITPAASAYLLFDRLKPMLIAASLFGVVGYWMGYALAVFFGVAPGPAVVVMLTVNFFVVLMVAPKYGLLADWRRRRRMVPQSVIEDILGFVLRTDDQKASISAVTAGVSGSSRTISKAISTLVARDWLDRRSGQLVLTDDGHTEATRLRRAHRLWETYLQTAGMPESEVHDRAHILEHVNDATAMDYLDDKLGHPIVDPHGSEIPQAELPTAPEKPVLLSRLRRGDIANIVEIKKPAARLKLRVGDTIQMGRRSDDGKLWSLIQPDGETVQFDHEIADAIVVSMTPDRSVD